ncbi:nitrilase-related carbon-nitrogen hydrolase [Thermophilibacter mediterraneus]|uniref:nitrilase-related carbon-nitrogen hydrolase n=1 Tax=Thermophilibacter mediterraneus TaxID=1871031 RepID=UPI003209337D
MRIAIAQMSTSAGDFEGTSRRMAELSESAAKKGVDLLVFPAPALCGITPVPYVDREGFLLDLAECLLDLVDRLACPCLVPVLTEVDGVPLPEAMLIADGSIVPVRLTAYLEAVAASDGAERPESQPLPEMEFAGARLGVAFTYDDLDDYDEYQYDVDVIVFLSGYGFATDDVSSAMGSSLTEGRFLGDAEATGAWIVGASAVGSYDAQVFCGSSFVLAPWGELAAQAPSFEEDLLVCDVDASAEGPLSDPLTPEVFDAPLMTWGALTRGLADACSLMGSDEACLVVDGTLGSSLVAALATDALGPTRVRALVASSGDDAADGVSERLVRALRIPGDRVERLDLSGEKDHDAALDLAQARLAALARRTGAVALGSSDKTGLALGPVRPLSAARVSPLADLYRSDVVALAHLRNTISPAIPAAAFSSLGVPEVPGLESMPSDEVRLEFVDLVLSSYLEWELPVSDIVAERGREEAVCAIVGRLRALEPVRARPGLAISVTSKTLVEATGPLGLAWADRVRADEERSRVEEAARALSVGEDEPARAEGPARGDGAPHDRDVRDLLGYLRDFSQGGGFTPSGPQAGEGGGRHGSQGGSPQPLWEGPFSEN